MKARPILMSSPMVRALLDGRKTQTRRIVKPQPINGMEGIFERFPQQKGSPYGEPGDLLAVKESAWMWCERRPNGKTKAGRPKWRYVPLEGAPIHFQARQLEKPQVSITHPETGNQWGWRLKVGRFLPRWASRLTLELTEVRVERLQEISEADATAEGLKAISKDGKLAKYGIPDSDGLPGDDDHGWPWQEWNADPRLAYLKLWESINGPGSWAANPWVWVLSFRVHQKNVDNLLKEM
jgi:hypothetical protein